MAAKGPGTAHPELRRQTLTRPEQESSCIPLPSRLQVIGNGAIKAPYENYSQTKLPDYLF
ncbi:hypothetical protein VAWG007_30340 [Aeromonas enteropelogenes]|nr:hypothetical protein VAWG007_30340 [Aeromonas enteropelogenes]